ncbi:hypothetical protein OW763_13385 [Clostridium aestuarii]|uniref:Uncharacterized protein n=1 Tax=Clostridium aestuarii TaxID=338193 RepID=A0ABT4D246_9CLOT|nr:hypothetical protein [Clostridium aestuarii]MCY6485327.1 hypothetical protein [Clostridium aestuarii]
MYISDENRCIILGIIATIAFACMDMLEKYDSKTYKRKVIEEAKI